MMQLWALVSAHKEHIEITLAIVRSLPLHLSPALMGSTLMRVMVVLLVLLAVPHVHQLSVILVLLLDISHQVIHVFPTVETAKSFMEPNSVMMGIVLVMMDALQVAKWRTNTHVMGSHQYV